MAVVRDKSLISRFVCASFKERMKTQDHIEIEEEIWAGMEDIATDFDAAIAREAELIKQLGLLSEAQTTHKFRCDELRAERDHWFNERTLAIQGRNEAIDRAKKAEQRIAELEAGTQWQPIETAPKDGAWALVYASGAINCAYVKHGAIPDDWTQPAAPNVYLESVTHWMPLPPAPTQPAHDKEGTSIYVPLGSWAMQSSDNVYVWQHNPSLHQTREQQLAHNIKGGFLCTHERTPAMCRDCAEKTP